MTEYAMMIEGELRLARPQPVTVEGVQHPPGVFRLWSDADLAALGVWRVDRAAVPEGQMATAWTLAAAGDRVTATPTLAPIPPQPVFVTVEQLASMVAPAAEPGGGLVVGRWYPLGMTVTVEGADYEVTQPFLYADAAWTPATLAAHLSLIVPPGAPWVQPTGAHDAYAAGAQVTHNGRLWENSHGDGNIWEPGVFGWTDLGPA